MGLFDKKYCDICGEKIGLLGNRKLEDGNLCKDCAKKLSPWFSDRRSSTVSEIKEQLAYREKNRERAAQFRTTRSYGEDWKLLLDEEHRWFTVTRARDLADANPDILDYTALTGCRVDIDESRTEQLREDADGKEVSYVPPRYEYSYDFDIIISVNHPYFNEMRFRLNDSSVDIQPQSTVQRPMMGQRPMAGRMQRPMPGQMQRPMAGRPQPMGRPMMGQTMNVAPVNFDPENSMEYRKYREMGDEIRAALQQVMDTYHPDRILIEPSGVGKLSDVIRAVQNLEMHDVVLNGFTTVVDATKAKMYMRNFGEFFENQLQYARTIILSRTDTPKATEEKVAKGVALIREVNKDAVIITTPIEKLDGAQILEAMEQGRKEDEDFCPVCGGDHDHEHHHDHDDECGCGHDHDHEHHHDDECGCVKLPERRKLPSWQAITAMKQASVPRCWRKAVSTRNILC